MEFQTYGNAKAPKVEKVKADILTILNRKIDGELPFVRATNLRRRVCAQVKAGSFYALLKSMENEQLIAINGVDETWAQCAVWDHPQMVEWRIQREQWKKEWEEIERRDKERQRQWEIDNALRIARERFQRELAEFFLDNSDQLLAVLKNIMRAYMPKKHRRRRLRIGFKGRRRLRLRGLLENKSKT